MSHERRVFLSTKVCLGESVDIPKADAHHLTNVLRLSAGSELTIIEQASEREFIAAFEFGESGAKAKIIKEIHRAKLAVAPSSIAIALLKGGNSEFVIEKATELAVRAIHLFPSARSIVRLESNADKAKKLTRFLRVAESAAKQSGQSFVTQINLHDSLMAYLEATDTARKANDRFFVCSLRPDAVELKALRAISNNFHLAVGPEGDFTDQEYDLLAQHTFEPVSLGNFRLKSETAALVAIAKLATIKELA